MKPIRLTQHAREQCSERGASEYEVKQAITNGSREPAKRDRILCQYNFPFGQTWHGHVYTKKQVAPVIKEQRRRLLSLPFTRFIIERRNP